MSENYRGKVPSPLIELLAKIEPIITSLIANVKAWDPEGLAKP